MKGFIEVFDTNINKIELINIQFIQVVQENRIAIYDSIESWVVHTQESYEELKQKIAEAMK